MRTTLVRAVFPRLLILVALSGCQAQIVKRLEIHGAAPDVTMSTHVGEPVDARVLRRDVAALWQLARFDDVRVEARDEDGGVAVIFHVVPRENLALREIRVEPHSFGLTPVVAPETAIDGVRAHEIALEAQRALRGQGFPNALVREKLRPVGKGWADLRLRVEAGKATRGKPVEVPRAPKEACRQLFAERREAESQGVMDFSARMNAAGETTAVHGPGYRVGRIEFTGNHHFSDGAIRRNFVLDEGQVFDGRLLRRSLARLNRTGWFEEIGARNVAVQTDVASGFANLTVRLVEKRSRWWKISGPLGPMSLAGPLQASVGSRLPAWGRGALELSTYAVSASLAAFPKPLLPVVNAPKGLRPVLGIQRPFSAAEGWWSGVTFAPQLGWRGMGVSYAMSQVQGRAVPWLSGMREPNLEVIAERAEGDMTMTCTAPRPRAWWLRGAAGVGIQLLGAMAMF